MISEEVVLAAAAEQALATGTRMVEAVRLEQACAELGVDHGSWFAALVALRDENLIQLATAEPSLVVLLALTNAGLERHLRLTRPDLAAVGDRLAAAAARAEGHGAARLAEDVGEPPLLVEVLLDRWVTEGRVVYSPAPGRRFRIHRIDR